MRVTAMMGPEGEGLGSDLAHREQATGSQALGRQGGNDFVNRGPTQRALLNPQVALRPQGHQKLPLRRP